MDIRSRKGFSRGVRKGVEFSLGKVKGPEQAPAVTKFLSGWFHCGPRPDLLVVEDSPPAFPGAADAGISSTGSARLRHKGRVRMLLSVFSVVVLVASVVEVGAATASARPNVLFVAIDDLRPVLGCYGNKTAVTPNIDRLADRGTVFQHAYCQQAVCSPSRMSLMTGRRPDTTRVWDLATHFRKSLPRVITLPQHFKAHGYHCRSIGKIYHGGGEPAKDPPSWSADPLFDIARDAKVRYATLENLRGVGLKRRAVEAADVPDESYIDGMVCVAALDALADLKKNGKPFFLAVGFRKPHLPFCAPKKYWNLYQRKDFLPRAFQGHPREAPEVALRSWKELEGYTDIPEDGMIPSGKVAELRHGYYACVSYVDALVGRLLERVTELDLHQNTVVCLWGDHGFHLGEQGLWTKANNYELSTRVPLIFSVPGQGRAGKVSKGLVELVDVYPTLSEVCGLSMPEGLEGTSLVPLLKDPGRAWKAAAFSQYPRAMRGNRHRGHGDIMGYAIRTSRYRYVEWREWKTHKVVARELYDHEIDPEEMRNVSGEKSYARILRSQRKILVEGWRGARPAASAPVDPDVP